MLKIYYVIFVIIIEKIVFSFFLGDIDEETYKLMTLPRCGVKDKVGPGFGRSKRYALQGKSNYNLIP